MIKILIADDHPIFRNGLRQALEETAGSKVIDEADNGFQALKKALENDYDVIILDISMPGMDGLEALKEIKEEKPGLPVLILSMHPEEQYAIRAIKAGASGYLTKRSAPFELIKAIKRVCSGGRYVTASLAEKMAFELDNYSEKPFHEKLSNREFQVMLMIASGKTVQEIADELSLSAKTISTYRRRILDKAKMKNNAEITRYVICQGLLD